MTTASAVTARALALEYKPRRRRLDGERGGIGRGVVSLEAAGVWSPARVGAAGVGRGGAGAAGVESDEGRGGGVVGRGSARVDLVARERGSKGIWRGRGRIARGEGSNGAPPSRAP